MADVRSVAMPGLPRLGNTAQVLASGAAAALPGEHAPTLRMPAFNSEAWRVYTTHLGSLSATMRVDFAARLTQVDQYYASKRRWYEQRLGSHMSPAGGLDYRQLHSTLTLAQTDGTPEETEKRTETLLKACGLWTVVEHAGIAAKIQFEQAQTQQRHMLGGDTASQIVDIGGVPFLLYIPPHLALSHEKRLINHIQVRRTAAIQGLLTTMLYIARMSPAHVPFDSQGLRTPGQLPLPGVPGAANALPPLPAGLGAIGLGREAAGRLAGPLPRGVEPRLSIVINLPEILGLVIPLVFLAVKLSFLIYIFGRHATKQKRTVMIVMAAGWIVWEGITIRRRQRARAAALAPADPARPNPQRRDRRQVEAAAHQAQAAANPPLPRQRQNAVNGRRPELQTDSQNGTSATAGTQASPLTMAQVLDRANRQRQEQANANRPAARPSSSTAVRRVRPNKLSPSYWMQSMARVGLSAEAREMGVSRSNDVMPPSMPAAAPQEMRRGSSTPIGIRPIVEHPNDLPPMTLARAMRNVMVCVVLFFSTLIPEVERLRKRALEKRQRKVNDLMAYRQTLQDASSSAATSGLALMNVPGPSTLGANPPANSPVSGDMIRSDSSGSEANSGAELTNNAAQSALARRRASRDATAGSADAVQGTSQSTEAAASTPALRLHTADEDAFSTTADAVSNVGDKALFDPPFSDEAMAAALADQSGELPSFEITAPPDVSGHAASTQAVTRANASLQGDGDGSSAGDNAEAKTTARRERRATLRANMLAAASRRQVALGEEAANGQASGPPTPITPGTPLLSPAEPGSEDDDSILQPDDPVDPENAEDDVGM